METTFQPSLPGFLSRIAAIEVIELSILSFATWVPGAMNALKEPGTTLLDQIPLLILLLVIVLGSWIIYNAYIRIARAGGRSVDIGIWVLASILTASYTFWAWTILDINRLIVSKLLYRGDAPVEYAWSSRSKQIRKAWEQAAKASQT